MEINPTEREREAAKFFREPLAAMGYVAALWHTGDVQSVRPDLTDEEAWEVLERCEAEYDQMIGLDFDMIERHAEALYPRKQPVKFRPYQPEAAPNVFTVRVNDRFDVSVLDTGSGVFIAVYPITNGVPWIDPFDTLLVDEDDVARAEQEMAESRSQLELPLPNSTKG